MSEFYFSFHVPRADSPQTALVALRSAFLQKPFNLPPQPAWCDSASGDGKTLILYLADRFCLFNMAGKRVIGNVKYRDTSPGRSTHGRYWMQNAPEQIIRRACFTSLPGQEAFSPARTNQNG